MKNTDSEKGRKYNQENISASNPALETPTGLAAGLLAMSSWSR